MNQIGDFANRESSDESITGSLDRPMVQLPIENPLARFSIMTIASGGNKIAGSDRLAVGRFVCSVPNEPT